MSDNDPKPAPPPDNKSPLKLVLKPRDGFAHNITLQEMFAWYATFEYSGEFRVLELYTKPDGTLVIGEPQKLADFKACYQHLMVDVDVTPAGQVSPRKKRVPMTDLFLKSPKRRHYTRLMYGLPGGVDQPKPGEFNAYRGWAVTPKAGDWSKNRDHIFTIICSGNDVHFEWIMNWAAAMIQRPGRHAYAALVLLGDPGVGKGYFINDMLGSLFRSEHYLHLTSSGKLTERFNGFLSGKVFVFADEAIWGGDKKAEGALKALVTEDSILIEQKFLPPMVERSMIHLAVASNDKEWAVPIGRQDRRYTVLHVSDARRNDLSYFADLSAEFNAGGREAMLADLLAWPVNEQLLRTVLGTTAKDALASKDLQPYEDWWLQVLESGTLDVRTFTDPADPATDRGSWRTVSYDISGAVISKSDIYDAYIAFLDVVYKNVPKRTPRQTQLRLTAFLTKLGLKAVPKKVGGVTDRVWEFPSLEQCRMNWTAQYGSPITWPEVETVTSDEM